MSELRELTDPELDIVGGGITRSTQPCGENLATEVILAILERFFEPQKQN